MLVIRASRQGKNRSPFYRIVISEKAKDTKGDFLEALGFFNPKSKDMRLDKDRILYWLSKGAKPSSTIHNLLVKEKIINGPKLKKGRSKKEAVAETEAQKSPVVAEKTAAESGATEKKAEVSPPAAEAKP